MDAVMEKDYVMAEMQKQIVDLKKRNDCLQARIRNLMNENEYYKSQYDDLKTNTVKIDTAYLELCEKYNACQNTIDTLAIRLADALRGK